VGARRSENAGYFGILRVWNENCMSKVASIAGFTAWRSKMVGKSSVRGLLTAAAMGFAAQILAAAPALATLWTDWTSATLGNPGSAVGALDGITVTYNGQVIAQTVTNGSFTGWAPDSSFVGGTVTSSPSTEGDIIALTGAFTGAYTLTFDSPVEDPFIAFFSLGNPRFQASLNFDAPPTFVVGGPSANFGGQAITVAGNTVSGQEGNGVVQFTGTFSSISWTTSTPEFWYGFTVGMPEAVPVPEPSSLALLGAAIGFYLFGRIRQSV
jgi:hypothetical protein